MTEKTYNSQAKMLSYFQRHNFGQQRHRIESKLKLRSLHQGISDGRVKVVDPFDFKQEFKALADTKLHQNEDDIKIEKEELLNSVHQSLVKVRELQAI